MSFKEQQQQHLESMDTSSAGRWTVDRVSVWMDVPLSMTTLHTGAMHYANNTYSCSPALPAATWGVILIYQTYHEDATLNPIGRRV